MPFRTRQLYEKVNTMYNYKIIVRLYSSLSLSPCPPYSASLTCRARYFCSQSSNTSITRSQEAGYLPAPCNQVWNISVQQAAGLFTLWFASVKFSFLPSLSNSNKTPKSFHIGTMEVIISILVPSRHFRERSSDSFGFVAMRRKMVQKSMCKQEDITSDTALCYVTRNVWEILLE